MEPILQLNEFFIEGGNQEKSHVLLHITEPSTPEEMEKGYFFAICEINNADSKHITKLQEIIDNAENGYYETPDEDGKTSLELLLEKINQEAFSLLNEKIELHCIVGAIRKPEIIFTYHGKPQMLLFYQNRQALYNKMDLIAENPEDPTEAQHQLFSHIIQGKIGVHDYLFLATPHIVNYFTQDRVQKIVTARPALQSAQHFEHVLTELRDGYSFGGLVVHLHQPGDVETIVKRTRIPEKVGSEKSLHSLFNTEKNTASTLSPSLFPRAAEKIKTRLDSPTLPSSPSQNRPQPPATEIRSNHINTHRSITPPKESAGGDKILELLQKTIPVLKTIGRGLLWIVLVIYSTIGSFFRNIGLLFIAITNYHNRRKPILEQWRRNWRSRQENFRHLPLPTKILMVVVVLTVLGFVGGISYMRMQARKAAALQAYQTTVEQIKTKRDAAESNLVYRNETVAMSELQSAQSLLATLPCETKDEKTTCDNLKSDLENILVHLRKVTTVTPELLTTFPALTSSTAQMAKLDNQIFLAPNNSGSIFTFDLQSKNIKMLSGPAGTAGYTAMAAPKENDYILLEDNSGNLSKLDPVSGSVSSTAISYPHEKNNITSLLVYSRKLYTLDAGNNQIYKHTTIRDGFDLGNDWIKTSPVDLHDGVDLTIDGDVYALKSNGQILKFTSGNQQDFAIQGLDPALTSANKIYTYTDVNNLYILDTVGKRLLVLDKTGQLKQQITANEFVQPTDMAIDEPNKTAYIIDSGRLFKIPLTF